MDRNSTKDGQKNLCRACDKKDGNSFITYMEMIHIACAERLLHVDCLKVNIGLI